MGSNQQTDALGPRRPPEWTWTRLIAKGKALRIYAHSEQSKAIMNSGDGVDIDVRSDQFGEKQLESHRQSMINATFIQSRGLLQAQPCDRCVRRGSAPFRDCRRAAGHFGGCCAACKWPDKASKCSFVTAPDRYDWRTPAPRPGTAAGLAAPPGRARRLGAPEVIDLDAPEVIDLDAPEVIDLESWSPSRRAITGPSGPTSPGRTPLRLAAAANLTSQGPPADVEIIDVDALLSRAASRLSQRRRTNIRPIEVPRSAVRDLASPRQRTSPRQLTIESSPRKRTATRQPMTEDSPRKRTQPPSSLSRSGTSTEADDGFTLSPDFFRRAEASPTGTPTAALRLWSLDDERRNPFSREPRTAESADESGSSSSSSISSDDTDDEQRYLARLPTARPDIRRRLLEAVEKIRARREKKKGEKRQ